jgi:hypothetical protein
MVPDLEVALPRRTTVRDSAKYIGLSNKNAAMGLRFEMDDGDHPKPNAPNPNFLFTHHFLCGAQPSNNEKSGQELLPILLSY